VTDPKVDPLPPEQAALLRELKRRPDLPADVRDAIFNRVTATLAGGMPPGSGGHRGSAAPPRASSMPRPSAAIPFLARPLATGLLGFALGGLAGALTYASLTPRTPILTAAHGVARETAVRVPGAPDRRAPGSFPDRLAPGIAPPSELVPPSGAPTQPTVEPGTSGVAVAPASARAVASPAPAPKTDEAHPLPAGSGDAPAGAKPSSDEALARERALVQRARTALSQGQPARALEAIEQHAAESPDGRLREDREALHVQALASAGRAKEARAALEAFRTHFPKSMLLSAAEGAVRAAEAGPR
jgi:hypothetical protein